MEYTFTQLENDQDVECCNSNSMFILNNGTDTFAMHIEVMLACIKFAADKGKIPPVPSDWWLAVQDVCDVTLLRK
jgi:hypothetical protein